MATNKSSVSVNTGPSFGLATILGVTFIVLKLTGVIDWAWIWVLSPFWIGFTLLLIAMFILTIVGLAIFRAEQKSRKWR